MNHIIDRSLLAESLPDAAPDAPAAGAVEIEVGVLKHLLSRLIETTSAARNDPGLDDARALLSAVGDVDDDDNLLLVPVVRGEQQRRHTELVDALMPAGVPQAAAVLQARRNAVLRSELLQTWGYLSAPDLADLAGSKATNRSAYAGKLRDAAKIFGVAWQGRVVYPAFQFGPDGRPKPAVPSVLAALPRDRMSDWAVAIWWVANNAWLGDCRPVDILDQDGAQEMLQRAARQLSEEDPL